MEKAQPLQPWKAIMAEIQKNDKDVTTIADTDTFKKGEAIVIGGQSRWRKQDNDTPTPSAKGLWYDTAVDQ